MNPGRGRELAVAIARLHQAAQAGRRTENQDVEAEDVVGELMSSLG